MGNITLLFRYQKKFFALFQKDNKPYAIEVMFDDRVIGYTLHYLLIDDDIKHIDSHQYLIDLAEDIRRNRYYYSQRKILNFLSNL